MPTGRSVALRFPEALVQQHCRATTVRQARRTERQPIRKAMDDYDALGTNWVWRSEDPWPVFDRTRDLAKIKVPMLTAGNWMDSEVHLPGNPTSYERASS